MIRTLHLTAQIPDSREILIQLPNDLPTGAASIVVEVRPETGSREDLRDIEDARRALAEAEREGTISLAELKAELDT